MFDYAEGLVAAYLAADHSMFIRQQGYMLVPATSHPKGVEFWTDIVAVSFKDRAVFFCEVKITNREPKKSADRMLKDVAKYEEHWDEITMIGPRLGIPADFEPRTWLFLQEESAKLLVTRLGSRTRPRVTPLEMCLPWKYDHWQRNGEDEKPSWLGPFAM